MTYIFHDIAHIILYFLDDLTTRSCKCYDHLSDLHLMFACCWLYNIRLNPLKCVFFIIVGWLPHFIISPQGIHLDPLKVKAILELPPPCSCHWLQILQGKANFLCRFLPDYTTQSHGFLRLLHQSIPFEWDTYAQEYFDALKQELTQAPLISAPDFTKDFILYISASTYAVAGVLIQEATDHREHVIYYLSKMLSGPSINYNYDEKLALVVVLSIQKLCHYILLRKTRVVTNSNPM